METKIQGKEKKLERNRDIPIPQLGFGQDKQLYNDLEHKDEQSPTRKKESQKQDKFTRCQIQW